MKVALLMSGHFRTFNICYESLKWSILDKYNPDVYISTWSDNDLSFHYEKLIVDNNIQDINNLMNIIKIEVDNYSDYKDIFNKGSFKYERLGNTVKPDRVLSMWFKRLKLIEMIKDIDYDIIIYTRPDIYYKDKLNLDDLNINSLNIPLSETGGYDNIPESFENLPSFVKSNIKKSDGYLLHTPGDYNGYLDTFCISNKKIMIEYLSLYNNIDLIYDKGCVFHPETLLKYYIDNSENTLNRFRFKTHILRRWDRI